MSALQPTIQRSHLEAAAIALRSPVALHVIGHEHGFDDISRESGEPNEARERAVHKAFEALPRPLREAVTQVREASTIESGRAATSISHAHTEPSTLRALLLRSCALTTLALYSCAPALYSCALLLRSTPALYSCAPAAAHPRTQVESC